MTSPPAPTPDPVPPTPPVPGAPRAGGCGSQFFWLSVLILLIGAGLAIYETERGRQLLGTFYQAQVSHEDREILLEVSHTNGDVLEVASPLKTVEIFKKSDARYAAWGWVYLGTTTSEIKIPVEYRFHILLSELERARIEKGVLIVKAPPIHPTLPVAFHSESMEKKTESGWARFDGQQQLEDLQKSITPDLEIRARNQVKNIRDAARADLQNFIQKWVVANHPVYSHEISAVEVVFEGEDQTRVTPSPLLP